MKSSSERTLPASVSSNAEASMSIPAGACQLTSTVSSEVGTGAFAPFVSSVPMRIASLLAEREYVRANARLVEGDLEAVLAGRPADELVHARLVDGAVAVLVGVE